MFFFIFLSSFCESYHVEICAAGSGIHLSSYWLSPAGNGSHGKQV